MNRLILLALFIISSSSIFADINNLSFNSDSERKVFFDIENGAKVDILSLLLVTDYSIDSAKIEKAKIEIEQSIKHLKSLGIKDLSPKKQIKTLKKHVQSKYQKSFFRKATFYGGIQKGYYNSFTGSAFYAYFLDYFDIPFQVEETRICASIIAYPDNESINISSFPPEGVTIEPDINSKVNYLNVLKLNKLIPGEQNAMLSEEEYSKYYYPENTDDMKKIAGLLYYLSGMDFMELPDVPNASKQFAKAFYLDKNLRNWYWYFNCLNVELSKRNFTVNEDFHMLSELANLTIGTNVNANCINWFISMMNNLANDQDQFEKGFRIIMKNTSHIPTRNGMAALYFYERGRIKYNQMDFKAALSFLDSCFTYNIQEKDFETLMLHTVIANASKIQSNGIVDFVQEYNKKYSFLFEIKSFKELLANAYLQEAYHFFYKSDMEAGIKYLDHFESFYKQYSEIEPDNSIISYAYSEGCRAHFNKRKYKTAREIAERGLVYIPEDKDLKDRVKYVKSKGY